MFEYKNNIYKKEFKTKYGSICISNIFFDPRKIEEQLVLLVFNDDNLKYMFAENELDNFKKSNILNRFIPREIIKSDLSKYVEDQINKNVNFYSFLAEGVLALVFRDIYDYELSCGVIDVNETLNDTHTGVDSCMYDVQNEVIILGEAKFYSDVKRGIKAIISDFKNKNIQNKLESLQTKAQNNVKSKNIIIKNLKKEDYYIICLEDFLKQKLIFAGFVLHSEKNSEPIYDCNFYNKFNISVDELEDNIKKCTACDELPNNYEIVLIHLPINDKIDLIEKIIRKAKEMRNEIRG